MNFYTSAVASGDNILVRGYDEKGAFAHRIPYKPTLYISPKTKADASWSTIDGRALEPIELGSISEAKQFIERYKDVHGFDIYGFTRFEYAYLNEAYSDDVIYDRDKIRIANIDIEVSSENGFPNPESASEEVVSITFKMNDIFVVFGCGDYESERKNVKYIKCKNEESLLMHIVTGKQIGRAHV